MNSYAKKMNDDGDVVGFLESGGHGHGFLYSDGARRISRIRRGLQLRLLRHQQSQTSHGRCSCCGRRRPRIFIFGRRRSKTWYTGGEARVPGGPSTTPEQSQEQPIFSETPHSMRFGIPTAARRIWGTLGGPHSGGEAINDNGQVTGWAYLPDVGQRLTRSCIPIGQ